MGSYPTYEEWKHTIGVTTKIIIIVLILPMRNGNPFFTYVAIVSAVCSYPTYEEWKHCFIPVNSPNLSNPCSYPTYEEWKLLTIPNKS